ncbi:MAG: terpene cyclase/mutase family protein [Candidatus Dormibacteraeota bacterium]|nr:terpene cyclase/mutase family protein [Candidatus Dormibacteraeota bacterium]
MKRQLAALAAAALAALASALPSHAFTPQTAAASRAIEWLHSLQSADGTVAGSASRTEDTVLGLVANGQAVTSFATSGKTPIDSLRSHIANEEKTAGNIGGLIMAVSAAGLTPTNFAARNLLQDLACTYDASTGAYNAQLFNDALAVLALPPGSAPAKAVAFLKDRQQSDGGWEFSPTWGSDTNTTAIVVLALTSANGMATIVKERALSYFHLQQKPSGGFEYSTGSPDSDPNSDAAVIQALLALGEDPTGTAWTITGKNAVSDLLTFQFENGGLGFSRPGSSQTATPDPLSTAQAVVALTSKYLPVKLTEGAMPSTCPSVPTTTPAPTPTPPPPQLAATGAPPSPSPLLPTIAGLAVVALGWRLRRRAR